MESSLSGLSSLKEDEDPVYVQPHYKETYRLAIYALLCGGRDAYEEFLQAEQISHFLSEEEIRFIVDNAEAPAVEEEAEGRRPADEGGASTYFPTESDEEVPDLDLGWPEACLEGADTSISLLFQPPRHNAPTIKEVVRKQIQEARQVVAIVMDVFTDVDIFKELVGATLRGVVVYVLLDASHFSSFITMSHRVGVNIHELKSIRVRVVQGQLYQCQSGMKFHGGLEQRFILVDGRTVLYGTYSFTWSFEKINLSMVLVVTGQLVCSYDEEFRRLYARSTVPEVQAWERSAYLRDAMQSPNSSQLSLHQVHLRARMMHGMRGAQDDRFNTAAMLTRGLSVQDRLHQSHCADVGNLVRGHSYGGELQKLNSMTRLRMGTKDICGAGPPDRTGSNLRGGGDLLLTNRLSQQHLRHRTRYGVDQNLIPFNSETSLHRWKMDTYLSNNDAPLDASCDAISPMASPYSSHTGLNEHQTQLIHSRSRDIKARMEEIRQKRLSLQEYNNFRQSQESLRSAYQTLERPKFKSSLRGLEMRQSAAELDPNGQSDCRPAPANHKESDGNKRQQTLADGLRSPSQYDSKMVADRKTTQPHDWQEALSRTTSAAELETKLNDASLKLSHLQPSGLGVQHPRAMESLTEIPEEKEGSNTHVNSLDSPAAGDGDEGIHGKAALKENSVKSSFPAESQRQDQTRGSHGSVGSAAPRERQKLISSEAQTVPKSLNASAVEAKSPAEKRQTQTEEPSLHRKNSMRKKVYSMLTSDEKKASKKEEKPLQRKGSLRSKTPSGSNPPLRAEHSQAAAAEQTSKKGQSPSISRSQNSLCGPAEAEKQKSPLLRTYSQRSSKRKTNLPAEQEAGSRSTLGNEGVAVYQRERVYSRYEYLFSTENSRDKSIRLASMHPAERQKSASLNRHDAVSPMDPTQSGSDNKLGRFMQRVGNLISKNK